MYYYSINTLVETYVFLSPIFVFLSPIFVLISPIFVLIDCIKPRKYGGFCPLQRTKIDTSYKAKKIFLEKTPSKKQTIHIFSKIKNCSDFGFRSLRSKRVRTNCFKVSFCIMHSEPHSQALQAYSTRFKGFSVCSGVPRAIKLLKTHFQRASISSRNFFAVFWLTPASLPSL